MDKILFAGFWMAAVMVVCGCVEEMNGDVAVDPLRISLENISTDKMVYHSSEIVNFNVAIYSNADLADAVVTVNGVGGRMNLFQLP